MSALDCSSSWQGRFLALLPAVQRHATIRFGRLATDHRTEAVQEAIAAACLMYQRAAVTGRLDVIRPGSLADFAVRHVRTGRHVGGRQDSPTDLLSPRFPQRHGWRPLAVDLTMIDEGGLQQMMLASRSASVADLAVFRIDFADWLASLSRRDRKIIGWLAAGEQASTIAGRLHLSEGRVSQLRRRYYIQWLAFQGELAGKAAA